MSTSAQRSWATRVRRKASAGKASQQERADLEAYETGRGKPGRPRKASGGGTPPAAPPPPSAAPAAAPISEPSPSADAGGGGAAPPLVVDLAGVATAPAPEGETPGEPAPDPQAEKMAIANAGAAYIVEMMRRCAPVFVEAELPLPPVPEMLLPVVEKAWQVTLMKWLPDDVGNIEDHAEMVACGSTAYQLGGAWFGRRKLVKKAAAKQAANDQEKSKPASTSAPPPPPPPSSSDTAAPVSEQDLPRMQWA